MGNVRKSRGNQMMKVCPGLASTEVRKGPYSVAEETFSSWVGNIPQPVEDASEKQV